MNSSNRTLTNITDIEGLAVIKNYIKNDGANTSTTGWVTYADAAAVAPVDGSGGSPTLTITRTTSSPISNDASFLLTKDAANRQGNGASYDFTIDAADKGRLLTVDFDYIAESPFVVSSGTTESDIEVYLYDVTNANLISVSPKVLTKMGSTSKQFLGLFQTSATSTSYRLILHVATTNASAYTFKFDNVKVSRANQQVLGAALTDWETYSMTINGVTSDPTRGATPTRDNAKWRRVGDSMQIIFNFKNANAGSAGSGNYIFRLPTGYTIDTTKIAAVTSTAGGASGGVVGPASVVTGSANARSGYVKVYDSTGLNLVAGDNNTAPETVSSASAGLNGTDVEYNFMATVPIQGWSANAGSIIQLQDQSQIRVRGGNGYGSTNTKIRRFTTLTTSGGSAITYADSATLGGSFTINESGLYAISYSDNGNSAAFMGISLNSAQLTTNINSITAVDRLMTSSNAATGNSHCTVTANLTAGDVIRAHTDGNYLSSGIESIMFTITKIAHQPALYGEADSFIAATGGTVTTDGSFKVHTFNSSGTFTITDGAGLLDALVVAAGGAGSANGGGGGGAGGMRYLTALSYGVGSYTVTVGAGGTGPDTSGASPGGNGGNSVFDVYTSTGGGGGGSSSGNGQNGGSGGGGAATGGPTHTGGTGTGGQGNNGGTSTASAGGSGGGGASAVGASVTSTGINTAGAGGAGTANSITGASVTYAGGGGGSGDSGGNGAGGSGGGGTGGAPGGAGTANTGGGGGGSRGGTAGGSGGSGVVIIRYQFQ